MLRTLVDLVALEHALPPRAAKTASELDDPAVKDLGWRTDTVRPPSLIKGMSNDDVFMLIRRFNKVRLLLYSIVCSADSLAANPTRARDSSPSSRLPRPRDLRRRRVLTRQAPCQPGTTLYDGRTCLWVVAAMHAFTPPHRLSEWPHSASTLHVFAPGTSRVELRASVR